jgi:tetratricopeptide (TPR) repeat protein
MHKLIILILLFILPAVFEPVQAQGRKEKRRHKSETKAPAIDRNLVTSIFIDATKAKILGDLPKALALFQLCTEKDPNADAAYYELSQLYYQQSDFKTAAQLAEKAADIDPGNVWYKLLLNDIYNKSGNKEGSLKITQQLAKQYPGNIEYLYELANSYLMMNKASEAIETYDEIEKIIGITEEISLQKQRIYQLQNKMDKAENEILRLAEAFPDEKVRYYSILAESFMTAGKEEKASEYYQKIAEADPNNPYIHISLADFYKRKGDKSRSFEELKAGFENPSLDIETKIRILMAYYTVQDIYVNHKDEALELAGILATVHPDESQAHALYGDLMLQDKQYLAARNEFRRMIEIDSSKYSGWESLMQSEASLLDWNALLSESSKALELFPLQPVPYLFKGIALSQLKQSDRAVKALNAGTKLVTDNDALLAQFYSSLGDTYNELKDFRLSDENYEKALKINGENSYVLNNYAYYLSVRGVELEKAETMAKKGAELDPDNPANLDTYGWVLFKLGKFEDAKKWIEKAVSLSTKEDPDLLEHLGDVYFKLGDQVKAKQLWQNAKDAGGNTEELEKKLKDGKLNE